MKSINDIIVEKLIEFSKKIILIIFWTEYCTPCEIMKNNLKKIKEIYKKKIEILKININYNQYTSEKFFIRNAPTVLIIKCKKIIFKKEGLFDNNQIKNLIKKYLNEG